MSVLERFLAKVEVTSHCWEWIGYCKNGRYGTLYLHGRAIQAHVLSHILYVGPVACGQVVMHACDNPRCVNPAHLVCGTMKENMQDCLAKGRFRKAARYKLSDEDVIKIKRLLGWKIPQRIIASKFGVTQAMICVLNKEMK